MQVVTDFWNSERSLETKFIPKTVSVESMYYFSYPGAIM